MINVLKRRWGVYKEAMRKIDINGAFFTPSIYVYKVFT
jgi:hypothetical protein